MAVASRHTPLPLNDDEPLPGADGARCDRQKKERLSAGRKLGCTKALLADLLALYIRKQAPAVPLHTSVA